MTELYQAVKSVVQIRRSCRKFLPNEVPNDLLQRVFAVVPYAPSSINCQPWHLSVVRDAKTKSRLAQLKRRHTTKVKRAYSPNFIKQAPVVVVLSIDTRVDPERWLENGWIATSFLILSAAALGLGACILTAYRKGTVLDEEIKKLLRLPTARRPVSILPIGYPDPREPKKIKSIKSVKMILQ